MLTDYLSIPLLLLFLLAHHGMAEFIKATGIQKQREAMEEKLKLQTAKQKMRERVNPKVGMHGHAWACMGMRHAL